MVTRRVGLTVVLLLASGLLAGAAPSESSEAAQPANEDLINARALRAYVGLDADPQVVEDSFRDADYSNVDYGAPLTAVEASALQEMIAAQGRLEPVLAAAAEQPSFVSAYFDRAVLHVVSTTEANEFLAELSSIIPAGLKVVASEVKHTRQELDATKDKITQDFAALRDAGITVSQVGVDPTTALVKVIVSDDQTGDAEATLTKLYGDLVQVVVTEVRTDLFACSKTDCGTRGGLSIKNGLTCTSGFLARNKPQPPNAFVYYMATAGHCIRDSSDTTNWRNVAGTITWGKNVAHVFGSSGDAGVYALGSSVPAAKSTYYIGGGTYRTLASKATDNQQAVGKLVCRHGNTSNYDCGFIRAAHVSVDVSGGTLQNMWKVELLSDFGDSGAGFIDQPAPGSSWRAAGILSGGTCEGLFCTNYTWYTTVNFMELRMPSYVICTTASC